MILVDNHLSALLLSFPLDPKLFQLTILIIFITPRLVAELSKIMCTHLIHICPVPVCWALSQALEIRQWIK